MAISNLDQLIAAQNQRVQIIKTATRTSIAAIPFSVFDLAGSPGAGTLAGTSTTAGVVPTDATTGHPVLNAFPGGATGYLAGVQFGSTLAGRLHLFDRLWKGGAYAFNAAVTLSAQPSYSSRVPGGTDFKGTEIWLETVTAFTGSQSIAVTYTNQDGVTGRTTGTIATGVAPTVGRMLQLPLQSGDTGVQKIESVTSTVSTAGTFNVLVMRRLWSGRITVANGGDAHDFAKTGMPEVFADSALVAVVQSDTTSTGIPELFLEIVSG